MSRRILLVLMLALLAGCKQSELTGIAPANAPVVAQTDNQTVIAAFEQKQSNVFVEGSGTVKKLLPDDNKGSRHQKFLVTISPEQTLLFAHNIDLAPRIETIAVGDVVSFRGEYVYNPKGGVVHWTHHDPQGKMVGGWIKHNGKSYE